MLRDKAHRPIHAACGRSGSQANAPSPAQTRAYSLDCRHGLVAAGGHQGRFAVWGVGGGVSSHAPVAPLMSARLFRGWISDVRFLSSRVAQSSGGDSAAGLSDDEVRGALMCPMPSVGALHAAECDAQVGCRHGTMQACMLMPPFTGPCGYLDAGSVQRRCRGVV